LEPHYLRPLSNKQNRFVYLYVCVLIICFSPFKILGALVPFIFLGGIIFYVKHKSKKHIKRFLLFVVLYFSIGLIYLLIYENFSLSNYSLFLITSASFLIIIYNYQELVTEELIIKLAKVTTIIILLESSLGLLQAAIAFFITGSLDTSAGDFVTGTIELNLFRNSQTGSNQMFSILVSSLLLFLLMGNKKWSIRMIFIIGISILSIVLASVMHSLIFLLFAILSTAIYSKIISVKKLFSTKSWRKTFQLSGLLVFTGILVSMLLPKNISNINYFAKQILDFNSQSTSPKIVATYVSINNLPKDEPLQPFIGIGLGQYTSRASLIRSGEYLTNSRYIPHYKAYYLEKYILPLYRNFMEVYGSGSTYFPFYSWLSLYVETGLIGIVCAISLIMFISRKLIMSESQRFPFMHYGLVILLFYIALLGFQDNYWEWSQAIFPAVLILRLGWQYLLKERKVKLG
jgi:hypothetical protein